MWGWRGWLRGPPCRRAPDPGAHVGGDAGGQVSEFVLAARSRRRGRGRRQQPTAGEDLGDAGDADAITVQHVDQLRVPQLLVIGMPGEQHDQRTVQFGGQLVFQPWAWLIPWAIRRARTRAGLAGSACEAAVEGPRPGPGRCSCSCPLSAALEAPVELGLAWEAAAERVGVRRSEDRASSWSRRRRAGGG